MSCTSEFLRARGARVLALGLFLAGCGAGEDAAPVQRAASAFEMPLWPEGPPTSNGLVGVEVLGPCISNISTATLTVYLPDADVATGAALVILPGGGYGYLCVEREGSDISGGLRERGIAAIVLKYRLPNGKWRVPGDDARRALRTVRYRASEWGIDPGRIGIWGFSAGGHLAGTVASDFDDGDPDALDAVERESCRPDLAALFFPVVTMEEGVTHALSRKRLLGPQPAAELVERYSIERRVTAAFPPTFMMHCEDDPLVPIENSQRLQRQLREHGVPVELLTFEHGGHGTDVLQRNPSWLGAFDAWLMAQGWQ